MTYKLWERNLKKGIKTLPKEERERIAEYYREMFDELKSGGMDEESAIAELGSPEKCAAQAIAEGEQNPSSAPKARAKFSAAEAVGLIFFTLLLILPFGAAALGIVIAFGAVALSGGVLGIGGLVFAVYFPFSGASSSAVTAGIGLGIAASGVGLLLLVGFFYATKWATILLAKALRAVYVRR